MTKSPANTSVSGDSLQTQLLHGLLHELDSPHETPFTYDDIQGWPAECREFCESLGWLREIERATTIELMECQRGEVVEPQWEPDPRHGTIGIYCCGNDYCSGIHYIEPDRMRQWKINFDAVGTTLATTLETPAPQNIIPDRLMLLGTSTRGDVYREFFLARGLWWNDAATILRDAARFLSSPAPTILAVDRLPKQTLWHGAAPAVLSLAEIIQVKRNRILADLSPAFAQKPTTPPDYSNWLTVTDVAKLLIADMSCDDFIRAKARVSTAANRGTIRTNGRKGEARLLEPISVNAWRLTQRDKISDAADEEPFDLPMKMGRE